MHSSVPAGKHQQMGLMLPGTEWVTAWRDREVWMQSEPRRPDGVLNVRRRARGEEGATDRDSSRRSSDPTLDLEATRRELRGQRGED